MTARDRIDAAVVIAKAILRTPECVGSEGTAKAIAVALEAECLLVDAASRPSDLPDNMQTIPAGSSVRRMRYEPNSGEPYRAVTVDVPGGTTVELWVDPQVAPVLAAQLANTSVHLPADMGDYRQFAEGELTGLQESGLECARCGRYVEEAAVATRLVGFTDDLNSTVVACYPRCGSSPWDVEQLRWLLDMPEVEPEDEEPKPRFTCDSCGFDSPVVYVDGDRVTCGKCRAAVSDGPARIDDVADPAGGAS